MKNTTDNDNSNHKISLINGINGIQYFFRGWQLICLTGIKRYVVIPIIINIIVMGMMFWWLLHWLNHLINRSIDYLPNGLQWINHLLWLLAIIAILLIFSVLFSTVTNWIAAPFNGLLAEQLENRLTGQPITHTTAWEIISDIPRLLKREIQKFTYYLPRTIIILLLYFIPFIGQTLAPLLWFLFSAWIMSSQYCDYPFDNHKISFKQMRDVLQCHKFSQLQFGACITLFSMVPLLNLFIMPIAVCGATAMWVDHYRTFFVAHSPATKRSSSTR